MKININNQAKKWLLQKERTYTKPSITEGTIPMHLGECSFPISMLHDIFLKTDFFTARVYPKQENDIRKKIAHIFSVAENMVVLGNGSDEIIENIPRVFLNPGDAVLIITPTFFRFIDASEKSGAKVFIIKTKREDNFRISEKVVEKIIKTVKEKKIKLIWICSPNNPTGIPIKPRHIEKIASQTNALIVLDQIYADLQKTTFTQPKDLIKKFPRVIILKSFSKVFGLAGLRVGFAIANTAIIKKLEKWHMPFHISGISLEIIKNLLDRNSDLFQKIKVLVKKERLFLIREMKKIKDIDIINGSETNLILFRHKRKNIFQELLKRNILVADFNNEKGIEGKQFARLSIGIRKQNILFLKTLREVVLT